MKIEEIKTSWDLSPLFESDDDSRMLEQRREIEQRAGAFVKKWKPRDDWKHDDAVLGEALDEYENLSRTLFGAGEEGRGSSEGYYFWLKTHIDTANPNLKARYQQIKDFSKKIENELRFFELEIARVPEEQQKELLASQHLEKYRHFLRRLFNTGSHLLSEESEKIMSLKNTTSYEKWYSMLQSFLIKEERIVLGEDGKEKKASYSEIGNLMSSQQKLVRDRAAAAHNEIIAKLVEIAEVELNALLENRKSDDVIRHFLRPDASRHLSDDIETPVVDALVKAVSGRFDIPQRYYKLKARLLGLPKLEYHERHVPYGNIDRKYTFEESIALINNVFFKLDPEFARLTNDMAAKGQIDVYPAAGKTTGGFCVYWLITHPTYILLNSTGRLEDLLTLAHEFGHALNNEFIKKKQHALNYGTSTATAEVASTFMEDFVLDHLKSQGDEEFQLALMMKRLNDDMNSIFRQVAGYQFEKELHAEFRNKGYLSKENIGVIFHNNMFAYLGDGVDRSSGSQNWWTAWHHIRYYFYVYSYASGLLISKYLQKQVRQDPRFIEKVKDFLSSGLSDYPKNIFARLGVDITKSSFWEAGLDEIEKLLDETEALARKLGRI